MVEKNNLFQNAEFKESRSDSPLKNTAEEQHKLEPLDSHHGGISGLNSANDEEKFNTLCDGVLTAHSMFDVCLTEMLAIKDEMLKHPLPSNLQINLTLTCSRLYRSASDLSVPTNELIRLVRLYSSQWEAKSNVFKKLHEDYESKQRRLDIAVKKLELVGITSERIEKEKRIMNWEKIFTKVMSAKSHGHRWKFLINSLKEKVKSGEILSIPFPPNSTDEEPNYDSKTETYIPRHHRRNVRSFRHQSLLRREARNSRSGRTSDEQQVDHEEESGLSSEEDHSGKHGPRSIRKIANDRETRLTFTSSRFKSKYPFEREGEFPRRFKSGRTETPIGTRSINSPRATTHVRRFMSTRSSDVPSYGKKGVSFFDESSEDTKPLVPAKEEKCVWTGETQYERFLHVRVYKPVCKRAPEPICTVCFGDQVFSGRVYSTIEESGEADTLPVPEDKVKKFQASMENKFQEFVFTLPEDKVFVKGKPVWNIESQQLRIAVQPGKAGQMTAMCTVEYRDLKIVKNFNQSESPMDSILAENYSLLSLLSDKETMFNSVVGHVPLVCYQTKKERLLSLNKSSQTSTIQDLFDEMMKEKRLEEEGKSKLREDEPEKVYTEAEFQAMKQRHAEELAKLREEYEIRLQEVARKSKTSSGDVLPPSSQTFVNACTSPVPMKSTSPPLPSSPKVPQRPHTADVRSSSRKRNKVKSGYNLPEWGKDLPANFFDRLDQFSRASAKYRQELSEKTRKEVQENYELQMATQNRLNLSDDEIDLNDVCLPALFMPSRMGTVYSPKATFYFHPTGVSKSRFTQPPSVFKLPCVAERDHSSVMNLFDLSQTFLTNGPTWLQQNGRPRSASSAVAQKNCSTTPSFNMNERQMKLKAE